MNLIFNTNRIVNNNENKMCCISPVRVDKNTIYKIKLC